MNLKVKVWIEDGNRNFLFGAGKTKVLTQLDKTGSVKETAVLNNMSEEKVLQHIKLLDDNVKESMVLRIQGQDETKETVYLLSVEARVILQAYEILDYDVKKYARQRFEELYFKK